MFVQSGDIFPPKKILDNNNLACYGNENFVLVIQRDTVFNPYIAENELSCFCGHTRSRFDCTEPTV